MSTMAGKKGHGNLWASSQNMKNQKADKQQQNCNKGQNEMLESDVSFDEDKANEILILKTEIESLKWLHNDEINSLRSEFNAKFDSLNNMVQTRNNTISKLKEEVGLLKTEVSDLKDGCSFLTQETTELKTAVENTDKNVKESINDLTNKAVDLEDRSHRNNLVFFGVPENTKKDVPEDCDMLMTKILQDKDILNEEADGKVFDRAHRLGPRKNNQTRPRPIIVRVTFFKDKEHILKNANRFKDSQYSVSEDFSKPTLNIRQQLISAAKSAKDKCGPIKSFKINYRRLVVKYCNPETEKIFHKGFGISEVVNNPYWYIPNPCNQASGTTVQR